MVLTASVNTGRAVRGKGQYLGIQWCYEMAVTLELAGFWLGFCMQTIETAGAKLLAKRRHTHSFEEGEVDRSDSIGVLRVCH